MADAYGEYEERVRRRAYEIWEQEGRPDGRADANWDLAREEVSTEENIGETLKDPDEGMDAESLIPIEGQADLPGRLSDQGERQDYPTPKRGARGKAAAG